MWSGQWPGPEPAGSGSGRAWASNMTIVLRAGPGRAWKYFLRAGPGPHNSVCGPGPGQVCTTAAGPGRAWASNHICGPGLGLNFRPVQGPSVYQILLRHTNNIITKSVCISISQCMETLTPSDIIHSIYSTCHW